MAEIFIVFLQDVSTKEGFLEKRGGCVKLLYY